MLSNTSFAEVDLTLLEVLWGNVSIQKSQRTTSCGLCLGSITKEHRKNFKEFIDLIKYFICHMQSMQKHICIVLINHKTPETIYTCK